MFNMLLIFIGAGFGGIARYLVSNGIHFLVGRSFPVGTLIVNISGSFMMGLLFVLLFGRAGSAESALRALWLTGFLGGYTTFSSFSLETMILIEKGDWFFGFLNVFLSTVLCLLGVWLGIYFAKQL